MAERDRRMGTIKYGWVAEEGGGLQSVWLGGAWRGG